MTYEELQKAYKNVSAECNRSIKRRIENLKNIGYNHDRLEV